MTDMPIAKEPFYSTTRRAGDTLYLSGFGPVDTGMNVVGRDITEFFDGPPMPTRRLIGAGDLFKGILVEIDGIAWMGD